MKVLILPYYKGKLEKLFKFINNDKMKIFVESKKRKKECALVDYSIDNKKFVFSKESNIKMTDLKKEIKSGWQFIGNNINTGTFIGGKTYTIIVCHKKADLSKQNMKKIVQFIQKENKRSMMHG